MQAVPDHATAYGRTFTEAPHRRDGVDFEALTPAERIALTIAVINRGLDLMDVFARTSLRGRAWGAIRGHYHQLPERERHVLRAN